VALNNILLKDGKSSVLRSPLAGKQKYITNFSEELRDTKHNLSFLNLKVELDCGGYLVSCR